MGDIIIRGSLSQTSSSVPACSDGEVTGVGRGSSVVVLQCSSLSQPQQHHLPLCKGEHMMVPSKPQQRVHQCFQGQRRRSRDLGEACWPAFIAQWDYQRPFSYWASAATPQSLQIIQLFKKKFITKTRKAEGSRVGTWVRLDPEDTVGKGGLVCLSWQQW